MNRNQRIKLLAIAAQVAQDTNGGGKRLSDVRTAFTALCEMIEPPRQGDMRDNPRASILITAAIKNERIRNLCEAYKVKTLGDLAAKTPGEVRLWRNCGDTAFKVLQEALERGGLSFGMSGGTPKRPTFRAGQWVRYKAGKSIWVTDSIKHIGTEFVRLDNDLDGGQTLLFRDYGKLWEVMP